MDEFEIEWAQEMLDFYPDRSTFWDSDDGQEVLRIAKHYKLTPSSDNTTRIEKYRAAMRE